MNLMTHDLRTTKGPSTQQAQTDAATRKEARRVAHEALLASHKAAKDNRAQVTKTAVVAPHVVAFPLPEHFVKAWRLALWHITNEAMNGNVDAKGILDAAFAINPRLVAADYLSVPPHVLAAGEDS